MTGSSFQLINGVILILTFFCARVIWGWYITYSFMSMIIFEYLTIADIYHARKNHPDQTPVWLASMYVVANLFLNTLNLYWFNKMIDSLRRRAEVKTQAVDNEKTE
jgi:hypothetical protein